MGEPSHAGMDSVDQDWILEQEDQVSTPKKRKAPGSPKSGKKGPQAKSKAKAVRRSIVKKCKRMSQKVGPRKSSPELAGLPPLQALPRQHHENGTSSRTEGREISAGSSPG